MEVALLTGMRRGEVLGLRWEDHRAPPRDLRGTDQSAKARQIPVNEELAEIFQGGCTGSMGLNQVLCSAMTRGISSTM